MSQIKGKNTKPEILVRKFLHKNGFRYRLHVKGLPGKPDLVLPKYSAVIFVHGCFWHGHHNCKHFVLPKTRADFWFKKISENTQRDKKNVALLEKAGWKVLQVWECEIKLQKDIKYINQLIKLLRS